MSTNLGANQVYAIKLLQEHGPLCTSQIAELLGIEDKNRAMRTMSSLRDRRLVYVSARSNKNESTWSLGDRADVNRKPRTGKQRQSDYRQRASKRLGKDQMNEIYRAQNNKEISMLVIDGVKVWERGMGILV